MSRMVKAVLEAQITWLDSSTSLPYAGERVLVSDGKTIEIKTRMKGIAYTGFRDYWSNAPVGKEYDFWALLPNIPSKEEPTA